VNTATEIRRLYLWWVLYQDFCRDSLDLKGLQMNSPQHDGLLATLALIVRALDAHGLDHSEAFDAACQRAEKGLFSGEQLDFSGIDLSYVDLSLSDLRGIDLERANLAGTDLTEAILSHGQLHGADLKEADLTLARLDGANLDESDLRDAQLPAPIWTLSSAPSLNRSYGQPFESLCTRICHLSRTDTPAGFSIRF
jgi:uncharacterized protein YjbI with pentapeptide repeats